MTLYTKHVLAFEGKTSNDPDDTAARFAPFDGAYHTNRGVTYKTYMRHAASLGLRADYRGFLALTDKDVSGFIAIFAKEADATLLPSTRLALAVTEAAWGSGAYRAQLHVQRAINRLRKAQGMPLIKADGDIGPATVKAANLLPEALLYGEFWVDRTAFIENLLLMPKFAKWKNGWRRRIKSFRTLFG